MACATAFAANDGTSEQTWMLGYEFPSTLMIMAPSKILFLAGASRSEPLPSAGAVHEVLIGGPSQDCVASGRRS
jgi:hypothetical protein